MGKLKIAVAAIAAFGVTAPAAATSLLDVTNLGGTVSYDFAVAAATSSTTVYFGGYDLYRFFEISAIRFTADTDPATNLIGPWTLQPTPGSSSTFTYTDSTGGVGLAFGATSVGAYDRYVQSLATTPGADYHLAFTYSGNSDDSGVVAGTQPPLLGPGPVVTSTDSFVPEPAAWLLMIGGLALTGAAMRRRRGLAVA